ncbi:unnamed protein product [Dicrocoelium dendriticum]|nr:unnamed protein product [Dicrocoelium dendriticum]
MMAPFNHFLPCYEHRLPVRPSSGTSGWCGVPNQCTMPLEYCEFSPSPDKCRQWLEKNLPEEFEQLVSCTDDSVPVPETHPKGRQVRGGKGTSRKTVKQKITVFKTSRGKKKYTTSVIGLSTFVPSRRGWTLMFYDGIPTSGTK